MEALSLEEVMDLLEELLDDCPEAGGFPLRTRGLLVTDIRLDEETEEVELITFPEHELG